MRISDWSSDVCSSDLVRRVHRRAAVRTARARPLCRGAVPRTDLHGDIRPAAERSRLSRLFADQERSGRDALEIPENGAAADADRGALLFRAPGDRGADGRNPVWRPGAGNGVWESGGGGEGVSGRVESGG